MHHSVREFPMLSLEKCRQILGNEQADHDLERLRDALYGLAGVVVTGFLEQRIVIPAGQFKRALQLVPANERDALEERAAIREYDGGLERDDAERAALSEIMRPS